MLDKSPIHLYILIVFMCCIFCEGYNILVVFPRNLKSHKILGDSCVELLLEKGHEVTYLSWGSSSLGIHQNLSIIDVSVPMETEGTLNFAKIIMGEEDFDVYTYMKADSEFQRNLFERDEIQNLINSNKTFDVAILEWLYGEYIVGLPAVFNCPYIWLASTDPHSIVLRLIGETANPAYVGIPVTRSVPPFSFLERVKCLIKTMSVYLYREFYIQPIEEKEYERVLAPLIAKRRDVVPSYSEVLYNASLILGNSHVSVGKSIQLPAAYKPIGGYHVEMRSSPLPKDIKMLLDNSSNGFIYFSMGSLIESKYLPAEIVKKILKVFAGLKQTVLWKFESDLPDRPSNVHIIPWAPQKEILAHPNCVLFITHGGLLSIFEAVHHGVPYIGIPVFVDQEANVKTLVQKGMAIRVDLHLDIAKDLKLAIDEILYNSSYDEAAKHHSFIYHHRPVPPGEEFVYWVEHVVRTKGATHLRSVTLIVPWYQKSYLDLALLVIIFMVSLISIVKRLVSFVKINAIKSNEKKSK